MIWEKGSQGDGLSAGDIVCWDRHVGICDGNGNVIHSYNKNHKKDPISKVSQWDGRTVKGSGYMTFFPILVWVSFPPSMSFFPP